MEFNVVIDIDGVITNLDFLRAKKKSRHTVLDTKQEDIYKNLIVRKILYAGISLYSEHAIVRNSASENIKKLKEEGSTIKIITKRVFANQDTPEGEKIRKKVELHLINHDIPYDLIRFVNGNKVAECTEEKADVVVEDNPDNILALAAAGFKVICYRTSYNEHINADNINIFEARSWDEVYEHVTYLKKEKQKSYGPSINELRPTLQLIRRNYEENEIKRPQAT